MIDHPVLDLTRDGRSGFVLRPEGGPPIRVRPRGDDWEVTADSPTPLAVLRRSEGSPGPFRLLESASGSELGRTLSLDGAAQRRELRYLLLGDGRLFRLRASVPAQAGFDLTGWVTPGAYLKARVHDAGWRLLPTPASGGIDDLLTLVLLFAAEILDADEPLVHGEQRVNPST